MKKRFITEEIAEWATSVSFNDIPESVILKTKTQILNNIAASFAGVFASGAEWIIETSGRIFKEKGRSWLKLRSPIHTKY